MSDHIEHWSSDDLEADAITPKTDLTCRPADDPHAAKALPHDAGTQSSRSMQANRDSQAGPTQNGQDATVSDRSAAGGAGFALDMTNERDRGLARQAMKRWPRRWAGLTDDFKREMVEGLKAASDIARECMAIRVEPLDAAKVMASVVKTAVAMEAQCQTDEHRADEIDRLDSGKATQAIKLYGIGTPIDAV